MPPTDEAIKNYEEAVKEGVRTHRQGNPEYRRQQASSIVIPQGGGGADCLARAAAVVAGKSRFYSRHARAGGCPETH